MHILLKRAVSVIMAAALVFGGIVITNRQEKEVQAAGSYKLVWSDEFNGTQLDRNNWNVEVNGYGGWNNELQYYCDSPENIEVSDGTLKLRALKKQYQGKEYTSARLNTQNKVTVHHGRIEARIKLPKFMGAFPAFWMMGTNGLTWPKCGEIDIMEAVNNESVIYGTAHWACDYTSNEEGYDSNGSSTGAAGINIDITQWHTYGVEWTADRITWYVDDKSYHSVEITSAKQMEELAIPCYLLLNFAVGGDWPGFDIDDSALPATMEVDYVRAYEKIDSGETIVTGVRDSVAEHGGTWTADIGSWANAGGSMSAASSPADGFQLNLSAVGNNEWGVQAKLSNLSYIPGHSYKFQCTLTSSINKNVFIKVEGDELTELAADYVSLKANTPYTYEKEVFIPNGYTGSVMLLIAPGGSVNGENIAEATAMNLKVTDVSFATRVEIEESTTEESTESPTTEEPTTVSMKTAEIQIHGYQISAPLDGIRTVYSVDKANENVEEVGLVYGLSNRASENEIYVESSNPYVTSVHGTQNGKSSVNFSDSQTATSYVMTMMFGNISSEFFKEGIYVRAYVKYTNGDYIYSNIKKFSAYSVADELYTKRMMNNINAHNYLYTRILSSVKPDYKEVDYNWGSTIVP